MTAECCIRGAMLGFWSLKAVEAGAEFVLGVDGRHMQRHAMGDHDAVHVKSP